VCYLVETQWQNALIYDEIINVFMDSLERVSTNVTVVPSQFYLNIDEAGSWKGYIQTQGPA